VWVCVQIKDLKRQVQQMQKKEEKLQDQLSALHGVQGAYTNTHAAQQHLFVMHG